MTLQEAVRQHVEVYGSLRAAARVLNVEPSYLLRLGNGEKANPGKLILRRMGLRRVVDYQPIVKGEKP